MVALEGYDFMIYQIKENIRIMNKYRESLSIEKDVIIRRYYQQSIDNLKKENTKLEHELNNRKNNPNK